ncbi:adenylate kinase [Candidatus Woesearchaeota archaeon]|nr:adenylate kinase [Candidatus Woesearchaeota archaeon]
MILIMLGPPGSGKGTQAERIMKKLAIPQISTGEMIRNEIKLGSELGKKVKTIVDAGNLVSDDIMIEIIKSRISQKDCKNGFILDGFPRTIKQADGLGSLLTALKLKLTAVINFAVDDENIIKRISTRRFCTKCGATYNIVTNPPKKKEVCDSCNCALILRDDDKEETVRNRLKVYEEKTQPLIDYYRKHKLLMDVDASRSIDAVNKDVLGRLDKL